MDDKSYVGTNNLKYVICSKGFDEDSLYFL